MIASFLFFAMLNRQEATSSYHGILKRKILVEIRKGTIDCTVAVRWHILARRYNLVGRRIAVPASDSFAAEIQQIFGDYEKTGKM